MEAAKPTSHSPVDYSPRMVSAIALASGAIAALNARISISPVASAWQRRASWSGYARALQLQSAEVDEIDLFSWGCGLQIAGRVRQSTTLDMFDRFDEWSTALADRDQLSWRGRVPADRADQRDAKQHPHLIQAFERVRLHARTDSTILPWLGLPFALRDLGLSAAPLPSLAGGVKAFRLKRTPGPDDWHAAIAALGTAARTSLERLDHLERQRRNALRAVAAEYRPGALIRLFALLQHRPLVSPQGISKMLGMSVAGASKLLERAVNADMLVEITARRSWRQFLTPDLAAEFGFITRPVGRPRSEPPPLPPTRDLGETFDEFDREMAAIDALLAGIGQRSAS